MQAFIAGCFIIYFCFIQYIQSTDQKRRGRFFAASAYFSTQNFLLQAVLQLYHQAYKKVSYNLRKTIQYQIAFKTFPVYIII